MVRKIPSTAHGTTQSQPTSCRYMYVTIMKTVYCNFCYGVVAHAKRSSSMASSTGNQTYCYQKESK
jgi:hypothetical protein